MEMPVNWFDVLLKKGYFGYKPRGDGMGSDWVNEPVAPDKYPEYVEIRRADNGFIVKVGCKVLVAKTWDEASKGLALYWKSPAKAEKLYCK